MTFSAVYDIIVKVIEICVRTGASILKQKKGNKMNREKITLTNPERFSGKYVIAKEKLEAAAKAAIELLFPNA